VYPVIGAVRVSALVAHAPHDRPHTEPASLVPKSGKRRAMAHLYPDEDRAQMFLVLKTFVSGAQDIRFCCSRHS